MSIDYYIQIASQRQGPYDVVSVIRKIRNYTVSPDTIIFRGHDEQGNPAMHLPEFNEVFRDRDEDKALPGSAELPRLTFQGAFKLGMEFLKQHTSATVLTGIMLFAWLISTIVFAKILPGVVVGLLSSIAGYFFFVIYQLCILRKSRMQLLTPDFYRSMFKKNGLRLLVVALITSATVFFLPIFAGMVGGPLLEYFLILIPGSFILTFLFFAPMLVFDRGLSPVQAIKQSISSLRRMGFDNVLVIYLMVLVNFSPLIIITLPITIGALCEIYDSHFNEY